MPHKHGKKKNKQKAQKRHQQRSAANYNEQMAPEGSKAVAVQNARSFEFTEHEASVGSSDSQINATGGDQSNDMTADPHFAWSYSEEQLRKLLLSKLHDVYMDVVNILKSSYGHTTEYALEMIISNGHAFGDLDVVSNIINNCHTYIQRKAEGDMVFTDSLFLKGNIKMLIKTSLALLISVVKEVRKELSTREVLWCLLVSDFHLRKACSIAVPNVYDIVDGEVEDFSFTKAYFNACISNDDESSYSLVDSLELERKVVNEDELEDILADLERLELDEKQKKQLIDLESDPVSSLITAIKETKQQLKERKEWGKRNVDEARKKLSDTCTELQSLRKEREKRSQSMTVAEKETKRMFMEKERALRKAMGEAESGKRFIEIIEKTNAEIRAEVEAVKLSTEETEMSCRDSEKRSRMTLKKVKASEKQCNRLQLDIEEAKRKCSQLEQRMLNIKKAREELEVKVGEEIAAKELAIAEGHEAFRLRKEAERKAARQKEVVISRKQVVLQKMKNHVQRLEDEVSQLKAAKDSNAGNTSTVEGPIESLLPDVEVFYTHCFQEGAFLHRGCLICMEREASIVFLPCAHMVICANCNERHCMSVEAVCPRCVAQITERICVDGGSYLNPPPVMGRYHR